MPIGCIWARKDVAAAFKPGDHATTFGGQPMAASAALATLEIMKRIDAPKVATETGAAMSEKLLAMDGVVSVRGRGLLIAAELDPAVLDGRTAGEVAKACLHAGLILNGVTPTALRIAPPITITDDEIDKGMAILDRVLNG